MWKKLLAILFVVFVTFSGKLAFAVENEPTKDQTWFGYIGKSLDRLIGVATSKIREFFQWILNAISGAMSWIAQFFNSAWSYLKEWFQGFVDFVSKIWTWFKEIFELVFTWIGGVIDVVLEWFGDLFELFCEWALELVWWVIEYNIDLSLRYADWCVGTGKQIFELILSYLPPITLPPGFEDGLRHFVEYGRLLDQIFPVSEMLMLLQLYFTVYIAIIVHQHVKGWWRWIGFFNK